MALAVFGATLVAPRLTLTRRRARWAPLALGMAALGMISLGLALVALGGVAGVWLAHRVIELPEAERAKGLFQLVVVLVPALATAYFLGRHENGAFERAAMGAAIPLLAAALTAAVTLGGLRFRARA